jgi:hypothetical protein
MMNIEAEQGRAAGVGLVTRGRPRGPACRLAAGRLGGPRRDCFKLSCDLDRAGSGRLNRGE